MKIPSEFKLFGQTIQVVFDDDYCHSKGVLGLVDPNMNKIVLTKTTIEDNKKVRIPKERIEGTFFHELVHHFSYSIGRQDLYENEAYTDQMSSLIHQFLQSKK